MVALELEFADVGDALVGDAGGAGNLEEIHAHAGGVQADGLQGRFLDHCAERLHGKLSPIDIGDVSTKHERGFLAAGDALEVAGLAGGELDGVGRSLDNGLHGLGHVLDPREESGLIEEAVVDGDIEAAAGFGVKEAVESVGLHGIVVGCYVSGCSGSQGSRSRSGGRDVNV